MGAFYLDHPVKPDDDTRPLPPIISGHLFFSGLTIINYKLLTSSNQGDRIW